MLSGTLAKRSTLLAYSLATLMCPLFMFAPSLAFPTMAWFAGSQLLCGPAPGPKERALGFGSELTIGHVALACWEAHFIRRAVETLRATYKRPRPIYELGASCWYALISAAVGWSLRPELCVFGLDETALPVALRGLGRLFFVCGEAGNAYYHHRLATLREASAASEANLDSAKGSAGGEDNVSKTRHRIPRGGLFELVSMPHYTMELVGFLGFVLVAPTVPAVLFEVASILTLIPRALESHGRYHREFQGRYPAKRKAIVPFLL